MKEVLSQYGVQYAYVDMLSSIGALKMFLKIRDTSDSHATARTNHGIGIPTLVVDDAAYVLSGPEQARELVEQLHLGAQEQ